MFSSHFELELTLLMKKIYLLSGNGTQNVRVIQLG